MMKASDGLCTFGHCTSFLWGENMSCTFRYEGKLKNNDINDIINVVKIHSQEIEFTIKHTDDTIIILFHKIQCESLIFQNNNGYITGSCKWVDRLSDSLYKIFDMLFEMIPLFESLRIDDDCGLWHEYTIQKQPNKITLRSLTSIEAELLSRMEANDNTPPDEVEQFVFEKSRLRPKNNAFLRVVLQDFIKLMGIVSMDYFCSQSTIGYTTMIEPRIIDGRMTAEFEKRTYFSHDFPYSLIEAWIGNAYVFRNKGLVKDLRGDIKGLRESIEAAKNGVLSIFLNLHSGGAINSKEAEMRRFAKKYYKTGSLGEVMVIDEPEKELEMLFSMMDYLGFVYVGV